MRAYVVARGGGHQVDWGTAFAEGLRRHGWSVEVRPDWPSSDGRLNHDLLVLWGVRRRDAIERQKAAGGEVCILERGYVGDRFHWTSVSFGGGLNGRAEFRGERSDQSRFDEHFGHLMRPWRDKEGYALLVGQVPGDMSLSPVGGSLAEWYARTARELIVHGHDVRFRPHPLAGRHGPIKGVEGARIIDGTLEEALAGASIAVTFNSNTGVESVLAGIPTVAMDIGSMAWPVTSHEFGETITPDRSQWAAEIAWKQWSMAELESGYCWEVVNAGEGRQGNGARAA